MTMLEAPPAPPPPTDDPSVVEPAPPKRRRWPLVLAGLLGVLVACAGAAAAWLVTQFPHTKLHSHERALAQLELPGMGTSLVSVTVRGDGGTVVPVRVTKGGTLWPKTKVRPGEKLHVNVVVKRPSWAGWLVGAEETRNLVYTVPKPTSKPQQWLGVRPGAPVQVHFSTPVRVVVVKRGSERVWRTLETPRKVVSLPFKIGNTTFGRAQVQAASRPWQKLSAPIRVTWFPLGRGVSATIHPAPGGTITPARKITITFSAPLSRALGDALTMPTITPAVAGEWKVVDTHTIRFEPSGLGYPFGQTVRVTLPNAVTNAEGPAQPAQDVLTWQVPQPSPARAYQLLSALGWLPLKFKPDYKIPRSPLHQLAAVTTPPTGTWTWKWKHTPASLKALWTPADPETNTVLKGAIMAFEDQHGLPVDGYLDDQVWDALLEDSLHHKANTGGYTYVMVSESLPEKLKLWHNGKVLFQVLANTGIGAAPTEPGTWPVFLHIPVGTMSGTNPDGSHYNDPGIQWISYFHGGDALHAFIRPGYGYPQSLGCVEMTSDDAGRVYPYTPIGTLVTVAAPGVPVGV
jgi:hypothetical protein